MTDLKKWHVVRDIQTGRRSCCYYDKDEPVIDFGEPDPLDGKEEIPEKPQEDAVNEGQGDKSAM
ncbi:MAG: hypothetical protein J1D87_07370 [Lachnospiraceae bacterium]|nr:hypothetical protein [Lachnospiraceae bacterium]